MNYRKLNLTFGWLVFLIATIVYFITIEDTVSLWDCGEYITTAYKLEVGHPPGAPLFMMIGRLFSFFAEPENVAVSINRLSALSSSLSILFMFWSITLLAKKIALKDKKELSKGDIIAVIGSGIIGSLAYTFSDSFWFSAVEGEVYAMTDLRIKRQKTHNFEIKRFVIDHPREKLYDRINLRVDKMMANGLLDEVKSVYSKKGINTLKTVGYSEMFSFLDGEITLERAVELIKQNTRRYAKRQLTWFRRHQDTVWLKSTEVNNMLDEVVEILS